MPAGPADKDKDGCRPFTEMLISNGGVNSNCILSSETSLEEKRITAPKYKKRSGAWIDHLMYANNLVPFIHLPPPQPSKPEPSAPKGRGRNGASQQISSTSSVENKKANIERPSEFAAGGRKKARITVNGNANESVADVLLTLSGR